MSARCVDRALVPVAVFVFVLCALGLGSPPVAAGDEALPPSDDETQAQALVETFKSKDPSARVRALETAKGNQHPSLTAPMIRLLGDRELGVRLGAIEALAARTDKAARRKAAAALAARLQRLSKGRADRDELMALIGSLGALRQPGGIKALLAPIHLDMDMTEVEARLQAVASIPHPDAVEALIDFLAKGRRGGRGKHRREANAALRLLTGANPSAHRTAGHDADRWRAWWKENKKTVDLEAVVAAREEAAAKKAAREERKKKQAEERKKKREERKNKREKKKKKEAPQAQPPID